MLPHPALERRKPLFSVGRLRRLVVLTADDQQIHRLRVVASQFSIGGPLQPNVVIRIVRVPVERRRDRTHGHAGADDVGVVRRLLGVDGEEVDERNIRCDHDRLRCDVPSVSCFDISRGTAGHLHGSDAAVETPASAGEGLQHAIEILERMELGLSREVQARSTLESCDGRVRQFLDLGPGLARGVQLLIEIRLIALG